MRKLSLIIPLIVGLFFGFLFGQSELAKLTQPAAPPAVVAPQEVSLMLDYGDGKVSIFTAALNANETLFDFTKRLTDQNKLSFVYKDYKDLGMLVQEIGSHKNSPRAYWQYWVNNKYAQVGASTYVVKAGDIIEWKLIKGQQP